jgi:hypothetical protein
MDDIDFCPHMEVALCHYMHSEIWNRIIGFDMERSRFIYFRRGKIVIFSFFDEIGYFYNFDLYNSCITLTTFFKIKHWISMTYM